MTQKGKVEDSKEGSRSNASFQQASELPTRSTGTNNSSDGVHFPTTSTSDDYDLPMKPDYLSDDDEVVDDGIEIVDDTFPARFRRKCGDAVNHPRVQLFIVFLIAVNALLMGIGTFDFIKDDPDRERAFEVTDKVFLIIFTVELVVQFLYRGFGLLTDGWLVFDLVIIVTSWAFAELQIIRAFRIFRALRLITRVQVMQNLVIGSYSLGQPCTSLTSFCWQLCLVSCHEWLPLVCCCFSYHISLPSCSHNCLRTSMKEG